MPLILISFLCVQILSAARDPVVAESALPIWLLALSAILTLTNLGLLLWSRSASFPAQSSHIVALIAFIMAGLKPISFLIAEQDPGPMYMAVVMLTGALCFLSIRFLLYGSIILVAGWLTAAILILPLVTIVSSLAIIVLGTGLSVFVLQKRIEAVMVVFALRQRLATLEAILPMCASCKKTRDHTGKWQSVEEYIEDHQSGTQVSHGSCPSCTEEMYGSVLKDRRANKR